MSEVAATSLLSSLRKPALFITMLAFAFLFFDLQYLIMSRLPGELNEMCVMGAGLNASNISFAVIISLLSGIFVVGFYSTLQQRAASLGTLSISSLGALLATMTVFCAACTFPVFSALGFAVGLTAFTTYNIWFKLISLALIAWGLYQIDRQLKGQCERCVVEAR